MKVEVLLERLEAVADAVGVKVSYEQLAASVGHGGLCRVKGQFRCIIDKRATTGERIQILATALGRFDTASIEMAKEVREALHTYSPTPTPLRRAS